jgi:hypothetical protein
VNFIGSLSISADFDWDCIESMYRFGKNVTSTVLT